MKGIAASLLAAALVAGPALAAQSPPAKTPVKAPATNTATKPAAATKTTAKTEPQKVASAKKHFRRHRSHATPKSFKPESKVTAPSAK